MKSFSRKVSAILQREFVPGTIFRVDMDRVDVAPSGSSGILRSLLLTGDIQKVKPGDPVQIISVAGERVALAGDIALNAVPGETTASSMDAGVVERLWGLEAFVGQETSVEYRSPGGFTFVMEGAGAVIAAGYKGYVQIPYAIQMTKVDLLASNSGSLAVEVSRSVYESWGTWTGLQTLSIASAVKNTYALDPTTWLLAEGDILQFRLTQNTAAQCISLAFRGYKV